MYLDDFAKNPKKVVSTNGKIGIGPGFAFDDHEHQLGIIVQRYTPILQATVVNPTMGAGARLEGTYIDWGAFYDFSAFIYMGGAGFAAGTGEYKVSLPLAGYGHRWSTATLISMAGWTAYDSSAGQVIISNRIGMTGGDIFVQLAYGNGYPLGNVFNVGAAAPMAFNQNDEIECWGRIFKEPV